MSAERARLGQSQSALAAVGGVTKQTQIKYESGESYPNAEYLAAVVSAGVDVTFVVTGQMSQATLGIEETRTVYALRTLKDSAREAVANMIDTFAQQAAEPARRKLPDTLPGEVKDVDDNKPAARTRRPGKF